MKKKIIACTLALAMSIGLTACNSGVKIDDPETVDTANLSGENVARAYVQSIFTNDEELFYACYPAEALYHVEGHAGAYFNEYKAGLDETREYYGIDYSGTDEFTTADGYDEDYMRMSIALLHEVDEDRVLNIELVKERVYFLNSSNSYVSTDIFMIVYELDLVDDDLYYATEDDFIVDDENEETEVTETTARPDTAWYFFEFASSDSDLYDND